MSHLHRIIGTTTNEFVEHEHDGPDSSDFDGYTHGHDGLEGNSVAAAPKTDLESWWQNTCTDDLEATVPKMQEYGALDLVESGRAMAKMGGWEGLTNAELIELGIAYYLKGKIERVMEAYRMHRMPSADTWKDITVYSLMGRAARERGGWGDVV